jgi:hypothetical protein
MYAHEERATWPEMFEKGELKPYFLIEYREHRFDPFWRSTRELEMICEYAILLEEKVKKLEKELEDANNKQTS